MEKQENDTLRCIGSRRSIRRYSGKQVPREALEQIVEAGLYAPSAGGRQGVVFLVSQDRKMNGELGRIGWEAMPPRPEVSKSFVSKEQPSVRDDPGIHDVFYGAPTVIALYGVEGFALAEYDCGVAAENMMLAAHSLGIGSCLTCRADATFGSEYGKAISAGAGIEDRFRPFIHVILGYPETVHPEAKPRREGRVFWAG